MANRKNCKFTVDASINTACAVTDSCILVTYRITIMKIYTGEPTYKVDPIVKTIFQSI